MMQDRKIAKAARKGGFVTLLRYGCILLGAVLVVSCKVKNPTLQWYKHQTDLLVASSSSKERTLEVLGNAPAVYDKQQTIAAIHQFAHVERANVPSKVRSSFFYAIDPDNTLIICFDDENKAIAVFFGGQ